MQSTPALQALFQFRSFKIHTLILKASRCSFTVFVFLSFILLFYKNDVFLSKVINVDLIQLRIIKKTV